MFSIINAKLYQIRKSRAFVVLLIISILLPILTTITSAGLLELLELEALGIPMDALSLIGGRANASSDYAILLVIAIAIIFAKEFMEGTIRNTIVAGKSRAEIYFASVIVIGVLIFVMTTASFVVDVVISALVLGFDHSASTLITGLLTTYALELLAMLMVGMLTLLFVTIGKKVSTAIVFPLLIIVLVGSILITIAQFVILTVNANGIAIMEWLPLGQFSLYDATNIDGGLVGKIIVVNSALAVIFGGLGYLTLTRSDIK